MHGHMQWFLPLMITPSCFPSLVLQAMAHVASYPGSWMHVVSAVPTKTQNTFGGEGGSWLARWGLWAEVGTAKGGTTTGVRLGCVPGKEHVIAQELCYKKRFLFVLRRGQHMAW